MLSEWLVFYFIFALLSFSFTAIINGAEDPKQHYAKYLFLAEFEKVTGLKGVKTEHKYRPKWWMRM